MASKLLSKPFLLFPQCPRSRLFLRTQIFALQRSRLDFPARLRYSTENTPITRKSHAVKYPQPVTPPKNTRLSRITSNLRSIGIIIKRNPFASGIAIFGIGCCLIVIVVLSVVHLTFGIFMPHTFPESVAKPARKAIYFSIISFQPQRAIKFYKEAIFAAEEAGLHYVSDEVIGLKVHLAGFFEDKLKDFGSAIMVYEHVYKECVKFLQLEGDQHLSDGHRSRVLKQSVRTAVKLGQLYGTPEIKRFDDAEEMLTVATETILKEQKRRKETGLKPGEGDFLDNEEVGASLEALATSYMSRKRFQLATPLYLHALSLCPPKSCHSVVLMNNLATSIAEQAPVADSPPNFPTLTQQAELWARKAIDVYGTIPEADRTDQCTSGCATAKVNLAEFAERAGRFTDALRLYTDAQKLSNSIKFDEGTRQASAGIARSRRALKTNN